MTLDTQSIIAIIALLISCPSTMWLFYKIYLHRQSNQKHFRKHKSSTMARLES